MVVRAVGWVRVRLVGVVSGRRLSAIAARMQVRRAEMVSGGMEMDVRAGALNELRKILRGSGVRMRVVKRYGIVKLRRAARRRGALVGACAGVLVVMLYLSQVAMQVRVDGAKDEKQEAEMLKILTECGVEPGIYVGTVDKERVAEEILSRVTGLTYAALQRRGMALELYVVQATEQPEIYDAALETDVVAVEGGLVTKVVALSGEALVRPGDTVVPGQVLIAGTERMPHARGAVTARVWAVGVGEAEMSREEKQKTGRRHVQTFIEVMGMRWPAVEESGFMHEQASEEERVLGGVFYPVKIIKCVREEVKLEESDRTISEVKDESGARAMTNALLALKNGVCVVDKRVEYSMIEDGKLRAVATLEGVMQIGKEQQLEPLQ